MILTIDQAAESIGVSSKTLRREIAAGRLPVVKIRKCLRIAPADLKDYIDQCRSDPRAQATKSVSSMPAGVMDALFAAVKRPDDGKPSYANASQIVSLAERRKSRSTKRSADGSSKTPPGSSRVTRLSGRSG